MTEFTKEILLGEGRDITPAEQTVLDNLRGADPALATATPSKLLEHRTEGLEEEHRRQAFEHLVRISESCPAHVFDEHIGKAIRNHEELYGTLGSSAVNQEAEIQ